MDDRETAHGENLQRQTTANQPLPTDGAQSTPSPDQPHSAAVDRTAGASVAKAASAEPPEPDAWFRNPDWYMVILTVLMFVVGIVTAVFFYKQLREMSRQTGIISSQAKQAADDSVESARRVERQLALSERQARAAQDNVEAIRKQMRQDQRAWIEMEQTEPLVFVENKPFTFNLHLANIGKTAARNLITQVVFEKLPIKSEPSLSFREGIARTSSTVGVLFPNDPNMAVPGLWQRVIPGTRNKKAETILPSATDVQEFADGKTYLAVYARTSYVDIFGRPHVSKFCKFYTTNTKSLEVPAKRCTDYNGVDNN